jgi:hypothetical protein
MGYETNTAWDAFSITSFSITFCTEKDWHSLPTCRTFQLCKYSCYYIRPQSSLYTHSPSYDGRQWGDSRYSILWRIKFGALTVNFIYLPRTHYGSLLTCCPWILECLVFLCSFILCMYIYVCISLYNGVY